MATLRRKKMMIRERERERETRFDIEPVGWSVGRLVDRLVDRNEAVTHLKFRECRVDSATDEVIEAGLIWKEKERKTITLHYITE